VRPVAITGLGLCSPLGDTLAATWDALLAGGFISDHARVPGIYEKPRVIALAQRAALEAVADAGWSAAELQDAALVVGTSKGPIEAWLEPQSSARPSSPQAVLGSTKLAAGSPQSLSFGLSEVSDAVASRLRLGFAPRLTLSTACASGLHALIRGAMLIEEGWPRAIVVAAESSLHPLFLSSFRRLGVLAAPPVGCRPFDEDRAGFLVSEAAAAVCLSPQSSVLSPHSCFVDRFAMAGDAVHLTGGDPSGQTIRQLLAAVIDGRPVDLVHAHGTGTAANDPIELAAIESVIPTSCLIYSHKGALGHSLGAAGLVATVLNCVCHRSGVVPPNIRTIRPLPTQKLRVCSQVVRRPIQRSVAVASGFGGATAAVSLARGSD
jgi:3-oxoacyl-[acyl-carrier-protein] synthase II